MTLNLSSGRLSSAAFTLMAPAAAEISSGVRGSRGWQPVGTSISVSQDFLRDCDIFLGQFIGDCMNTYGLFMHCSNRA